MPSSTFFNLPEEKREKFLRSARTEFARVPYDQASINKIIQAADIPRGSFYMYFNDKGELFRYLLEEYQERLAAVMEQLLERQGGDLFSAFLEFFDFIQADYLRSDRSEDYEIVIRILEKNPQLGHTFFPAREERPSLIARLCAKVDRSRLSLRGERDLEDMFLILAGITGPAMVNAILVGGPGDVRERYVNVLSILKRGMENQAALAQ